MHAEATPHRILLTLSEEDAEHLRAMVQNPVVALEPQGETSFRYRLFDALTSALGHHIGSDGMSRSQSVAEVGAARHLGGATPSLNHLGRTMRGLN